MLRRPRRLAPVEFQPDPEQRDQDVHARREMHAFDDLAPDTRQALADSAFGCCVSETVRTIHRRGISPKTREELAKKGVMPCDAGDLLLLEEVKAMEAEERKRVKDEIERKIAPRSTHAAPAWPMFGGWR